LPRIKKPPDLAVVVLHELFNYTQNFPPLDKVGK
jgi:hypothetical protein